MSFPAASGYRDMSASTMRYTPAVYSAKLLAKFYNTSVLTSITNTNYEGEIKSQGDTVYIRGTPDITIRNYYKGMTVTHEQPVATPVTLLIDQGRYWAFVTDSVETKQTDLKDFVNAWTTDAAEQLKDNIETAVHANIYADVNAYNTGATAGIISQNINLGAGSGSGGLSLTKSNIIENIIRAKQVLDEQKVPKAGRFFEIPAWASSLIMMSDYKDASLTGDGTSVSRNGRLGVIAGFEIFEVNTLKTLTDGARVCTYMNFGVKMATTFATQLTENKVGDNPFGFGMLHKGLQVFGYKVVLPKGLGVMIAYQG